MADSSAEKRKKDIITTEEENYLRVIHLLLRVATPAVRTKFNLEFHPTKLQSELNRQRHKVLEPLKLRRVINQKQWKWLFPVQGVASSFDFDLTLMICLIRNMTDIQIGDVLPHPSDESQRADFSRLKHYRNEIGHCDGVLSSSDFEIYWSDICQAIIRIGGSSYSTTCTALKTARLSRYDSEICTEISNEKYKSTIPKGVLSIHVKKIEEWQQIDETVVETRAILQLMELVKKEDVITVIGPSGCGKTIAVQHVALQLNKDNEFYIIPIYSPEQIIQYYDPDYKQLYVFDDVCGICTVDISVISEWEKLISDIQIILQNRSVKILMTCKSHIFNNRHFQKLTVISKCSCDLLSKEYKLSNVERIQIASTYLSEDEVNELTASDIHTMYDFFPLLCKLYKNKDHADIVHFFSCPMQAIEDDLTLIMNSADRTIFATLLVIVLYNNKVDNKMLNFKSDMRDVLVYIADSTELHTNFTTSILKSQLKSLEDSYVKISNDAYSIIHDKVFDIMVSFYGNLMFDLFLELCHSDMIRDRFLFVSIGEEIQECIINVHKGRESEYFDRLMKDIRTGYIWNVFTNRQLQYPLYRKSFLEYLETNNDTEKLIQSVAETGLSPLHAVSGEGYYDLTSFLINLNLNIDACDQNNRTPLFLAALKGYSDIVEFLLERKANPDICDADKATPLYIAACQGYTNIVHLLLKYKANPDLCNKDNRSPILLATCEGHTEIIKLLLDYKCDPNLADDDNLNPLSVATHWNYYEIVSLLLQYCCNPDVCGKERNPPLHIALSNGNIKIVELFLKYQCDANVPNCQGEPTLYIMARLGYLYFETINAGLQKCHITHENIINSLELSVTREHVDVLRTLLDRGYFLSFSDQCSLLSIAANLENIEIVHYLLQRMFCREYNISPTDGKSRPLQMKRKISDHEQTQRKKLLLIQSRMLDRREYSPFMFSPSLNTPTSISYSTEMSSADFQDTMHRDLDFIYRGLPLHAGVQKGHVEIVELLLQYGFNPNKCDNCNQSPLYLASREGHQEIVRLLLEKYKCGPDIKNEYNVGALEVAITKGHAEIASLLLDAKNSSEESAIDKTSLLLDIR